MNNVSTYIKWRGDLTFKNNSFNEADCLVLCDISYRNFKGIVSGVDSNNYITLMEAYQKYVDRNNEENVLIMSNIEFFESVSLSKRFSKLKLHSYVDILDDKEEIQFSAITIDIDKNISVIVFRGTDNTLIGWKEDFNIACEITRAQKLAVEYVNQIMKENQQYILAGHSKGGNLAVYGAMMCNKQSQIISVYSLDGPGICFEHAPEIRYRNIENKIIKFIPEFDIVGLLFDDVSNVNIIKSGVKGIMQHDYMNWIIEVDKLVRSTQLDKTSKECLDIIQPFLKDTDVSQRKKFIDSLFGELQNKGYKTIMDISQQGIDALFFVLQAIQKSSGQSQNIIYKLFTRIYRRIKRINYVRLLQSKMFFAYLFIFFCGVFFIANPQLSLRLIGTFFYIWLLIYSIYHLIKIYVEYKKSSTISHIKFVFFLVIAFVELLCILQRNMIILSSNVILGGFFLYRAYYSGKLMINEQNKMKYGLSLIHSLFACLLGIIALVSTIEIKDQYMLVSGSYLIIFSLKNIYGNLGFQEANE